MIKTILPLSSIIALRFLGLFIVLPVLSVYALQLDNANEVLVGITIGGYAITQMFLQIPFGILSDKIGRKVTIAIGLLIFIAGSLVCAWASDIYTLMIGRLLQGSGAIGAVGTAMISDMVKEEVRAKAMAVMGGSIAASFAISMLIGPIIGGYFGADKLFLITAILCVFALILLFTKVPNPPKISHSYALDESKITHIIKDKDLMKMNITNMLQKGMMTLAFLIIPILMLKEFDWTKQELWKVYLPAMICGVIAMGPSAVFGEKKHKSKELLMLGIILFAISYLIMGYSNSVLPFVIGITLFFIGFNIHEPLLQSMASKYAKVHQKGAALGIFNAFGYIGTFFGGVLGGFLLKNYGITHISWVILVICLFWIFLIASLRHPGINKNIYISYDEINLQNIENLHNVEGIIEWYKNESEKLIIIKYDSKITDKEAIVNTIK